MIHNRWHPDIPMVAWVNPGDDFIIETYDWTGGFIKNNDSADDVRDIDLSIVHFLSGPIGVKGAEPGDLLVVDLLDVGPLKESLWGFNGFFSKQERRRLPDRPFPAGAEVDLGHQGPLHLVAPHSRRELRGPDPSRPDRLSARSETAGDLERARDRADRDQSDPRAAALPIRRSPPTAHAGQRQGRRQGQGRRRGRPHRAAARAWRQLRHQGSVARLEDLFPGLCAGRRALDGRSALQPGRRRDHLLRRHRNGRLAAHQGRHHQGRRRQIRHQESRSSSRRRSRRTTRTI